MGADLDTLRRLFLAAPFVADLGIEPLGWDDGRLAAGMAVRPRHLQHTGSVHAGVMATLADHAMGIAAQLQQAPGRWIVSVELKTSLLRPALGRHLRCEAWVIKPGRSLCFTEAEVWADDEGPRTLVMKASATMAVVEASRLAAPPERT